MDNNTELESTTTINKNPSISSRKKDKTKKSQKTRISKRLSKAKESSRISKIEIKKKNDNTTKTEEAAISEIVVNNDSAVRKTSNSNLNIKSIVNNEEEQKEKVEEIEIVGVEKVEEIEIVGVKKVEEIVLVKEKVEEIELVKEKTNTEDKTIIEVTNNDEDSKRKTETKEEELKNIEYMYSKVLETYNRNNIKDNDYFTLPKCDVPTTPEYKKTEDFIKQSITDATINKTTSTSQVYLSILQCLQNHCDDNEDNVNPKDVHMLYKILHSLRKSISTIVTATDNNNQHMHGQLLNLIFQLSTTYNTPNNIKIHIDIKKELNTYQQLIISQVSKSVVRHKLTLLKETKLGELKQQEIDRQTVFDMYYNDENDHKLLLVHLQLIIELVSSNCIFVRPALSFLFRIFWNIKDYNYVHDSKNNSK